MLLIMDCSYKNLDNGGLSVWAGEAQGSSIPLGQFYFEHKTALKIKSV